jgi:hypothetical protein
MQNITVEFIPGESKENKNQTDKFLALCTGEELSKLSATSLVLLQSSTISVFFLICI